MTEWTLQPILGTLGIFCISIALVALLFIKPPFSNLTPRRRWILSALRLFATVLLVVAMLRPGCSRTVEKQQTAVLLMLCDFSRSMQLPHLTSNETRFEAMRKVFVKHQDRLKSLNDQNILVKAYGFDQSATPIEFVDGKLSLPDSPEGSSTDIGTSLDEILKANRSQRIAGTILISDGVQNEANPDVEVSQAIGDLLQIQAPLYTTGLGQQAESGQFADIAIENLADQFSVFVNSTLKIKANLRVRGFVNQKIPIRLLLEKPNGQKEIVYTDTVEIKKDGINQTLTIPYTPTEPGQFRLVLSADEQESEWVTRNNQLPAFLTVYDGGLRVLYLHGNLGPEQRYLKASVASSADIEFDFVSVNPRGRARWPLDASRLFDPEKYDVIIFADVDSRAFSIASGDLKEGELSNFERLENAIDAGTGFMMIGGSHSFGPGLYHSTPLGKLLPVEMDPFEKQSFEAPLMKAYHLSGPLDLEPTEPHFLTSFTNSDGAPIWEGLPPMLGANRFKGTKRSARILLQTKAGDPIMVADSAGGRVLALAADSTWVWYTHDEAEFHKRFWRQIILWLAGRDGNEKGNVWVDLSQRRFSQGVPVAFSAGAKTSTGEPIKAAEFKVELIQPNGESVVVLSTGQSDLLQHQIAPKQFTESGLYKLKVTAKKSDVPIGITTQEFIIFDQDKEKSNPIANLNSLSRYANQTKEFGGRPVLLEDFGKLLNEIESRPLELKIEVPEKWKLGDTTSDALCFVLVLISITGSEWYLRKRWGMV